MSVTKRIRFEVLRRDEHTCQYCGAKAPDVTLNIDHVLPVSLGGDDKPGNLVTACKDCNTGKASIAPDSPLVQGLSDQAAAYALGMVDKMTRFRADLESLEDYVDTFDRLWNGWKTSMGATRPLPGDYQNSLYRWMRMGIPTKVYELAIGAAMEKCNRDRYFKPDQVFPYMAGIVWNMVNDREIDYTVREETAAVYSSSQAEEYAAQQYQQGLLKGRAQGLSDGLGIAMAAKAEAL